MTVLLTKLAADVGPSLEIVLSQHKFRGEQFSMLFLQELRVVDELPWLFLGSSDRQGVLLQVVPVLLELVDVYLIRSLDTDLDDFGPSLIFKFWLILGVT